MAKSLDLGDPIPLFTLKDQHGNDFQIRDWVGRKTLVIYFYPKDESGICTKEACAFRDSYQDFTDAGAMVIAFTYKGFFDGSAHAEEVLQFLREIETKKTSNS